MSRSRSISLWLLLSLLFVIASGLAVLAARKDKSDTETLESRPREVPLEGVAVDASRVRNLSLQPEAAKLSKKLGQRFVNSDSDMSVLIGEVATVDARVPVRVVRRQDKLGESVEVTTNGKNLSWSAAAGLNDGPTELDQSLIERIAFDSADAFILAQLRGAAYQIVGKNVRSDLGGADNYDGPLWTVVRVSYAPTVQGTGPESSARLYYINSRTGFLDRVISVAHGEEIEANLEGWTTESGETFPSLVRWSSSGRQIMEFRLVNFVRSSAR